MITALAAVLGVLLPTLMVLFTAGGLRLSAGGAHCSAPWRCNLLGVLVFPLLGYLVVAVSAWEPAQIWWYVPLALLGAVGAVLGRAPVLTANKPLSVGRRHRLRHRSRAKVLGFSALVLVLLSQRLTLAAVGLSTGLLWQGFTLLPLGSWLIGSIDRLFMRLVHS
jgi:accessory gene regulator B